MKPNKGSVSFRGGLILIGGAFFVMAVVLFRPSPKLSPTFEAPSGLMAVSGESHNQTALSITTESDSAERTTQLRELVQGLSQAECNALVERLSSEQSGTASAQLRDIAARQLAEAAGPQLATNCLLGAQISQQ